MRGHLGVREERGGARAGGGGVRGEGGVAEGRGGVSETAARWTVLLGRGRGVRGGRDRLGRRWRIGDEGREGRR